MGARSGHCQRAKPSVPPCSSRGSNNGCRGACAGARKYDDKKNDVMAQSDAFFVSCGHGLQSGDVTLPFSCEHNVATALQAVSVWQTFACWLASRSMHELMNLKKKKNGLQLVFLGRELSHAGIPRGGIFAWICVSTSPANVSGRQLLATTHL